MTDERYVVDASALLAMLVGEPGGDAVASLLSLALVSAVNWSEVLQKARQHGADVSGLREDLESLGMELVPFGASEAAVAADIWHRGGSHLALADRACLATAMSHQCTVVTADRAWSRLDLGVDVEVIR
ncbi:MAG TPA: type II toxin-antitoxin system VapC family toxin [Anaerolineae bacterium]|nr:type II toxin-antitoxin system VapC family toxin [Anaerolineae bacterium]